MTDSTDNARGPERIWVDVKRYGQGRFHMFEMKEGPFVRYIDHANEITALRARLEELEKRAERAKAAAQADYEARIMAALEPANPLPDPRVKALVEAVRHEREMVCQDFDMQLAASQAVDAALAAFEGGKTHD